MVILRCYFQKTVRNCSQVFTCTCRTLIVPYSTNQILKCGVFRAVLFVDDKDSHYGTGDDFRKCDIRTFLLLASTEEEYGVSQFVSSVYNYLHHVN